MLTLDSAISPLSIDTDLKTEIALAVSGSGLSPKTDATSLWDLLRLQVLTPAHPIALHRALADWCFQDCNTKKQGPRPIWRTSATVQKRTNLHALIQEKGFTTYKEAYDWSIAQGREFWATMVMRLQIPFKNNYTPTAANIVDLADLTSPKWLPGASLNIADANFTADPEATAIVYQKEGSTELKRYSYGDLEALANRVASALVAHGFTPGDRIAIDMPMNVEAIAIYFGILKMGGAIVCLADSFKAMDIDIRLEVAAPVKLIFTQDKTGGVKSFPLYPDVIKAKFCPPAIVVSTPAHHPERSEGSFAAAQDDGVKLLRDTDRTWQDFIAKGSEQFTSVAMPAAADVAILFSSSTSSGKEKPGEKPKAPKAIPWRAHTAIKSAADAHLHHDLHSGKTLCWPTNLGWMMGSFAMFAAFMNRATLAVFDGSAVSKSFIDFVAQANVNVLGLVPSLAEGWEQQKLADNCQWDSVELFSSTGSPSNPQNYFYLMSRVPGYAPVFEYMGGTEIGGAYLTSSFFHDASPSAFTTPNLGTELFINDGRLDAPPNEAFIVMRGGAGECPPMGLSTTLLNFDHREKYFAHGFRHPDSGAILREHGDLVAQEPGGFYVSNGRADDGMNINGIKTSSLDIENYIKNASIPGLAEVAAVAVRPPEGGEDWLVVYAVGDKKLENKALFPLVKDAIKAHNPQLAKLHDVVLIDALPLTASGKLRRRYLQDSYLENHRKKAV